MGFQEDFMRQFAKTQAALMPQKPACDDAAVNAAKTALETETAKYLKCLPSTESRSKTLQTVNQQNSAYAIEVDQLNYLSKTLMTKITDSSGDPSVLQTVINDAIQDLQNQQEVIKHDIRKEQRLFTDSNIQQSPAVAGLYYTQVPDNKILIAFMSCFGAFLLFIGLMIIFGLSPIDYFTNMLMGERLMTVGLMWSVSLIFTYIFFFAFT
ncbi:MAG: hypothetical protein EB127_23310 [Alphaproteobacteria bacterium]|nr:hypothetical protein [Alphaproteobacteria bacterium]